jgi:ATP-dependent DNA helicase RecG
MTKDELLEMLKQPEWNHFEIKAASTSVSEDAYTTVSAFANTAGGWLVFGVEQDKVTKKPIVSGVADVETVASIFINALRGKDNKLSKPIDVTEDYFEIDGKHVVAFYIKEAARYDKPIYSITRDRKQIAYLRRAASDVECTPAELVRLHREASGESYDGQVLEMTLTNCFNTASIDWYRAEYHVHNSYPQRFLGNTEFLRNLGLVVEKDGKLFPTRACILLFGSEFALNQLLSRPIVDCQWLDYREREPISANRYEDRKITYKNLIETWGEVLNFYQSKAYSSFKVDPQTLQRIDEDGNYYSFREAAINLLLHQDYAVSTSKASIKFYQDTWVFYNPGCSPVPTDQLLDPGERQYRNPLLVKYFQRIKLCEQMGVGIQAICGYWRDLGFVPPEIKSDKANNAFTLRIIREKLLSEEQLAFRAAYGLSLNENEAKIFALVCRQGKVSYFDIKAVSGLDRSEADPLLRRLLQQQVIRRIEATPQPYYLLADHLKQVLAEKEEPPPVTTVDTAVGKGVILFSPTNTQIRILRFCSSPRTLTAIKKTVGPKGSRSEDYRQLHLIELVQGRFLELTKSDKPVDYIRQEFVTTSFGNELVALRYTDSGQEASSKANE